MKYVVEYVWIDANGDLRSKNRLLDFPSNHSISIQSLPKWNFDGSSTGQAETIESERFLKPVYICNNPFTAELPGLLVLCAVYNDSKLTEPGFRNNYHNAAAIFENQKHTEPWFGYEQEFFLFKRENTKSQNVPPGVDTMICCNDQGQYYCSIGSENALGREVINSFISHAMEAELSLYGTNAEVAPGQWEFQIGTVPGIESAHQLWLARYILVRVAEKFDLCVSFSPKPYKYINGSGCHTNFSNNLTRCANGFQNMKKMFVQLGAAHKEHINNYGSDNEKRLTGIHETSSMDKFTWSVSGRHTSVRVGRDVEEAGCGYFEDRRPASNCDPYLVASLLVKNTDLTNYKEPEVVEPVEETKSVEKVVDHDDH
jgi:glutamine synthetase